MKMRSNRYDRCCAAFLTAALFLAAGAQAQPAADAESADLPVTRVVASTAGIAYFEHEGTVTDTRELVLDVPTDAMDDLLQSLVLQDFGGGEIRPVRYGTRDPLPRILGSYPLDLTDRPTLAELLDQARGEELVVRADRELAGILLGIERERDEDGDTTYLVLSTDDGLRRVAFHEIQSVQFARESLQEELEAALLEIARHRDDDTQRVRLRFEGDGERRVRVGYVREMPVWKTSYRLVANEDGTADVQGWAILDNPTRQDLVDVNVAFVAGRPISFVTELFEPVYVERRRVSVDTDPSVVPEADRGGFQPSMLRAAPEADEEADVAGARAEAAPSPSLSGAGVEAMATGSDEGASFVYRVDDPVTVQRYESVMVPIVQATIPARDVSVLDPTLGVGPLRGVRIENQTGVRLAAGTVSVFDAGGFAGNARLGHVPPGESRLLSYAEDLDVRVLAETDREPERVTAVRLRNGVIETDVRQRVRSSYRVEATADVSRLLVVEHPRRSGYEVVGAEPAPVRTDDAMRFGVALGDPPGVDDDPAVPVQLRCAGGEPCVLNVVEERQERRTLEVRDVTPDRIAVFLENAELTETDRELLEEIQEVKRRLAQLDRAISEQERQRQEIHEEQQRIRANMQALERNSSLYRRYISDLESQENELDAIRTATENVRSERADVRARLDELIRTFTPGND